MVIKTEKKELGMEFIKTVYCPKNDGVEIEQWWLADISVDYMSLGNLSNHCQGFNNWNILQYFENLSQIYVRDITFRPITEANKEAIVSRKFNRGNESDAQPMIYRGKGLPEFKANFYKPHDTDIFKVTYSPNNGILTDGARKMLHEKFDSQLIESLSQKLLDYLKLKKVNENFDYLNRQMSELKQNMEKFKVFLIYSKEEFIINHNLKSK
jgi:hypothetical protein